MRKKAGIVYLTGAGPGAINLATMAGLDVLRRADTVIYDHLVNPGLLRLAPPGAELIYAGKTGGGEISIEQARLNRMLIEHARKGRVVVRLKGGDPFIFGRGGEEAEALAGAGIPYEVIPGVTSAIAAPAYAGIPLTHREYGSFVAFVTGHEDEKKGRHLATPWRELATAAKAGRGTIVILMGTRRMRESLEKLKAAGLPPNTPAAAIQQATSAGQKTVTGTLANLAEQCVQARLQSPAVIVIGKCAALREKLKWAERMPLFGRRIVVTRAGEQAARFAAELRAMGAEAIEFPVIEIAPPASYAILDRAIARLGSIDWIIFTSATGVERFFDRLKKLGRDIREIGTAKIAAIGPATSNRVRDFGLKIAAMPREYRAEALIPAIGPKRIRGARILIPRAAVARDILPKSLRAMGAREVLVAPAYRTIKPKNAAPGPIRALIAEKAIDLVTFTSSSTVENFAALLRMPVKGIKAAAIGPITAATARRYGFKVVVQPRDYTTETLIASIDGYFRRK
ncbi:MAG TPA: uroporphyrinogen-III C-methyltransferase [Candidatus Binataceae bacterium]|nr:uroporphyrinogen-III C-methyltransferase [Candidatus Binataceae bacterium]